MALYVRSLVPLLLLTLAAGTLQAQDASRQLPRSETQTAAKHEATPLRVRHITDQLNARPEAQRALRDFHRAKTAGLLQQPVVVASKLSVGAMQTFRVIRDVATDPTWEERTFILQLSQGNVNIWVEEGEWNNQNVDSDDVQLLGEAMLEATPEGSIDPQNGIIVNNDNTFGSPPNVDGDGVLDVLLYDIVEGDNNSNSFVAGFVSSSDLFPTGGGNNKDILYLDTNPGIRSRPIAAALSTAAHEYQHLIHFNFDLTEFTFVNEGLSEWAEILNGYGARDMVYLQDPSDYNISLVSWDEGANVLYDYQRAGLFTSYLAQRVGTAEAGALTRSNEKGTAGYSTVLQQNGLSLADVLPDFHSANLYNNLSIDPQFGYEADAFRNVLASLSSETDGRLSTATPRQTVFVEPGAVYYLAWSNVQDFTLTTDTVDPFANLRNRVHARVILEREDGSSEMQDLTLPADGLSFAGTFQRIVLQLSHVRPDLVSSVGLTYEAAWTNPVEGTLVSTVYDTGTVVPSTFFSLSAGVNSAAVTRFDVPEGAVLQEVSIAPYFLNQFSGNNVSESAPRDLSFGVWRTSLDGEPGSRLFNLEVTDPRPYAAATTTLSFFDIDLTSYEDLLNDLPDQVFIGYSEAGSDENFMVIGPSRYTQENLSYVSRSGGGWGPLWEIQFQDSGSNEFPLENTVLPVRARFRIPPGAVSNAPEATVPLHIELSQNYPNPVNNRTRIAYALPASMHVNLTVHDLLGREVAVLVDASQPAGQHEVIFVTESLQSGLYLYTLQTGEQRLTRKMMIVR